MSTQIQTASSKKVFVDLDGYDRIRAHSPQHINQAIEQQMQHNVHDAGELDENRLSDKIERLDREWDIDRALMLFFAAAVSTTVLLGTRKNRKWLGLLAIQLPFLAYHATVGWCPPVSLFRRLGFRSSKEIDAEKYAMKTLRGDFVA